MRFVNHRLQKLAVAMLVVLTAAVLSSAILAQAGPPGHHRAHQGMMKGRMIEHLDLTDEQQAQVEQILDREQDELREQAEQIRAARLALFDAVHASQFDEAAIRQAAAYLAVLEADQAVARASMIQQLHQVLTPEQIEKAREHREHMRELHEDVAGPGRGRGQGPGYGHGRFQGRGHHCDCPVCGF